MQTYLASMAENEETEVWDVTEENDEIRPEGDMNMPTLMEDVDSESGSQNLLQGVSRPWERRDYDDSGVRVHKVKRIVADARTTNKPFP